MSKKKPTKKEFETVISRLINHVRFLDEKLGALDSLFGLYLEWRNDKAKVNKFVETKVAKHQRQDENKNEPGEKK